MKQAELAGWSRMGLRARTTLAGLGAIGLVTALLLALLLREARDLSRGFLAFEAAEASVVLQGELATGGSIEGLLADAPADVLVSARVDGEPVTQIGGVEALANLEEIPFEPGRARIEEIDGNRVMLYDSHCQPQGSNQCELRVGVPDDSFTEFLGDVWWDIAKVAVPVLVAAILTVPWLVGRSMKVVGRLTEEANQIDGGPELRQLSLPAAEDEIHELAETLNRMLLRSHIAHENQRRFIADASHELRSPAAGIQVITELATVHPHRKNDERTWQRLRAESERLGRVVTQMLDLTTMEARKPVCEPVDLRYAISDAASGAAVAVEIQGPADAFVMATVQHLQTIFRNLFENAGRYGKPPVTIAIDPREDKWEVLVQDAGEGISAQDAERIFEPFIRLDSSRSQESGGAGLGLAIARQAARACGGDLNLASASPMIFRLELVKSALSDT